MSVRVLLLALMLVCACKGVGRSLVDNQKAPKGRSATCAPAPSCSGLGVVTGAVLSEQTPALMRVSPAVCPEGVSANCTGNPSPAVGDDCGEVWNVDDDAHAPDLSELGCTSLRITTNGAGELAEVTVDEARWSGVELAIESTRPFLVRLHAPQLQDVHIALSGPVTLEVDEQAYLQRVQISAQLNQLALPTVHLEDSTLDSFSILREGAAFPGDLRIERGYVNDSWLSARVLDLDSLILHNTVLQAPDVDVHDVQFYQATLSFDDARLSGGGLYKSRVRSCSTALSLDNGVLQDSELAACKGDRMRIYQMVADRSSVAGIVDSEDTVWTNSLFGVDGQLALTAYRSHFDYVNFCANTGQTGFGGQENALSCSQCAGKVPMCRAADADVQVIDATCPQLSPLEVCEHALPPPGRPSEGTR